MLELNEIKQTQTYRNHLFHIAMCDFAEHTLPTMYFNIDTHQPVIKGLHLSDIHNGEISISDIPNTKGETYDKLINIYNSFQQVFEQYQYNPNIEPIDIKKAYNLNSYYELTENENFKIQFGDDMERLRKALVHIQKEIVKL